MHSTPSFEKLYIQKEGMLLTGGHFFIAGGNIANCRFQPLSQTLFPLFNLQSTPSKEMTTEMMEACCYLILYGTHGKFFTCESNFSILVLVFPTSSLLGLLTTTASATRELKHFFPFLSN